MAWGGNLVDVFRLRRRLVDDYGSYISRLRYLLTKEHIGWCRLLPPTR